MEKSKIKTPWYSFYDGVKEHLEYPNISVYKMLENSILKHQDYISYNYYGTKRTYKDTFAHDKAKNMILNGECGYFSNEVIRIFKALIDNYYRLCNVM